METLNLRKALLEDKLDNMLNTNKTKVLEVVDKIERDVEQLEDSIVPFGTMSPMRFTANGSFKAIMGDQKYDLHNNALTQLCYLFGVPGAYAKQLLETDWGRQLLQEIFMEHNDHSARKRMLVRNVGSEIRGVLSDKYRRLDSRAIYNKFITEANSSGAVIVDAHYEKVKQYITVVFPKLFEIQTQNNGIIYSAFGARIANSDYGNSALHLNSFHMQVVCENGLIGTSSLSAKHLGKRLSADLQLSERTYRLDTQTMASAVGDITANLLNEDTMRNTVLKIKGASEQIIDMDTAIKKLPKEIHKPEIESIKQVLQNGDEEMGIYGKPTMWKLSQAITAVSNQKGGNRKQELDEIAGRLLKL